jgi:hypothetical protein
LLGFCARRKLTARFVLVITGKGGRMRDDWSERGVLKRQVPQWLRLPEFRSYVVGFEDAHIGHGGEGALYVACGGRAILSAEQRLSSSVRSSFAATNGFLRSFTAYVRCRFGG